MEEYPSFLPSRSSMVFSSFATDLSANSARVSAWKKRKDGRHGQERGLPREPPRTQPSFLVSHPQFPATGNLTSFSFSSRSLISSSYLSSLVEYFKRHTHAVSKLLLPSSGILQRAPADLLQAASPPSLCPPCTAPSSLPRPLYLVRLGLQGFQVVGNNFQLLL